MQTSEFIDLENQFGAHNYKPLDVVLSHGKGVWVWDVEGKKYLDCLSAYSAVNQGHCHPKILEAMIEQAKKLTLTSRAFRNDQLGLFYKDLCELTRSHKVLPMNSGAEAVETAIKVVRKWGYKVKGVPQDKAEIIVCETLLWDSAQMKILGPGSGPLHLVSRSSPLGMPMHWRLLSLLTQWGFWWSRSKGKQG